MVPARIQVDYFALQGCQAPRNERDTCRSFKIRPLGPIQSSTREIARNFLLILRQDADSKNVSRSKGCESSQPIVEADEDKKRIEGDGSE